MILDSTVWGPHFWFFLHTIAITYPKYPNTNTKKKYYEFLHTMLPLFIPVSSMSSLFKKLLDEYPVTPYLDTRDSFIRWIHFIHNKINQRLEKPQITLEKFYEEYYALYKPKETKWREMAKWRKRGIGLVLFLSLLSIGYYFYKNG